MKIVLTKKEFEDFTLEAVKTKYGKILPDKLAAIDHRYDGTVEIEFIEMKEVIE